VNAIRQVALRPHAKELTFPDRYSLSVFKAEAYLSTDGTARQALASKFHNDTYWFDQMACSSPRLLIWVGGEDACRDASAEFYPSLERELQLRDYQLPVGPKLNKLTFAYRSILDHPVVAQHNWGPELTVLELAKLSDIQREHCGGGLLYQAHTPLLDDIAGIIERRDQTITHFGFNLDEVRQLARCLNGRGVDRLVRVGQALTFNRYWDGYDLLHEFCRIVYLEA
jgi:hypothetical protein